LPAAYRPPSPSPPPPRRRPTAETFSLGCGSWGNTSISHNITWRDLINVTYVSRPLAVAKELKSDEELFGRVMQRVDVAAPAESYSAASLENAVRK
jgi:sulfoacetaldehyde dehydrogenase